MAGVKRKLDEFDVSEVADSNTECANTVVHGVNYRVGKAHEMYPSVLNSLMGVALVGGHMTVGGTAWGWSLCLALTV